MSRVVVVTSFPVFPPRGGGQQRVFGLYGALARRGVEVEVVSLVGVEERGGRRRHGSGFTETRVPRSRRHDAAEYRLQQAAGAPAGDVALALHHELTPEFSGAIACAARDADVVVASHPYGQPAIAAAGAGPLVYEAHNVEADLKRKMLAAAPDLVDVVRDVERACCREADHVVVCSREDGTRLRELFDVEPARVALVPNGIDPAAVRFASPAERAAHRERLGLTAPHAVFMGSWHEPNLEAAREVLDCAGTRPDVRFLVLGSVGVPLSTENPPPNVDLCGPVPDGFVRGALAVADVALNPMRSGSGTNLKMLDYALAGAPIASTPFGARGLDLHPDVHYVPVGALGTLAGALTDALATAPEDVAARVHEARHHVSERFGWPRIAADWLASAPLRRLLEGVPA